MMNMSYFHFFIKCIVLLSVACMRKVYGNNLLIDSGSSTNTTVDDRVFLGDSYASKYLFTSHNLVASTTKHLPNKVYQTARVFQSDAKYTFPTIPFKRYTIRIYLFPFTSTRYNLSNARFSIKGQSYIFLKDFTPSEKPTIKEFSINTTSNSLRLSFEPSTDSFAFINAIEVVQIPDAVFDSNKYCDFAFETMYRVNVGGQSITPNNDILGRFWTGDDMYLVHTDHLVRVQNVKAVKFRNGLASRYDAPKAVYGSARRLTVPYDYNLNSNVTWNFVVDSGFSYLVRLHFCDILGEDIYNLRFSIYVNSFLVSRDLDLNDLNKGFLGAPVYIDFVTPTLKGEKLAVSIRLIESSGAQRDAILNGIEIIKMNNLEQSLVGIRDPPSLQKHFQNHIVLLVCVGFVGFLFVFAIFCVLIHKWKRNSPIVVETMPVTTTQNMTPTTQNMTHRMPFVDIQCATADFHESRVIGKGGFGKVYMGVFGDGTRIAVKRRDPESKQGLREFQTEVEMLSEFRHRHLVSLLWCCSENGEFVLGYEYVENGNLKDALRGSSKLSLTWKQRLEICIGAARALEYLHTGPRRSVIHGDVKPSNILIDGKFRAKLSDFGLSTIIPEVSQSIVNEREWKGTIGFVAPEVFNSFQLSTESDVYSFGAVLYVVLCAKDISHLGIFLPHWVKEEKLNHKGNLDHVIDPMLQGRMNPLSLEPYLELADMCMAEDRKARPSMTVVLYKLDCILAIEEGRNPARRTVTDNTAEASTSGIEPFGQKNLKQMVEDWDREDMPSSIIPSSN